jgi:hypothetical protein
MTHDPMMVVPTLHIDRALDIDHTFLRRSIVRLLIIDRRRVVNWRRWRGIIVRRPAIGRVQRA